MICYELRITVQLICYFLSAMKRTRHGLILELSQCFRIPCLGEMRWGRFAPFPGGPRFFLPVVLACRAPVQKRRSDSLSDRMFKRVTAEKRLKLPEMIIHFSVRSSSLMRGMILFKHSYYQRTFLICHFDEDAIAQREKTDYSQ